MVGTLLGFGLALLIAALTPLPAAVEMWSVALGIGITAVVGLFFGLYPAIRAATGPRSRRCAGSNTAMATLRSGLLREIVGMSLDTLRTSKMRSALTVLGVVIGITSIRRHDVCYLVHSQLLPRVVDQPYGSEHDHREQVQRPELCRG